MKNLTPHHRNPDWSRNWSSHWSTDRKGSILIWTLLLGFVLTSVFFFFAMRQRAQIAIERDTAAILNAKTYVESYAGYLEKHPSELDTTFDGIQVKLTQNVDEIEGSVDFGQTMTYEFSGDIYIEWNKCTDTLKGDLYLNSSLYEKSGGGCTAKKDYDDVIGPVTVTNPFTIKTMNAPFKYRITEKTGASTLVDNKWHLDLEMGLDYGNRVSVKRTF